MSTSQSPILVINNGSSSLKFSVLDPISEALLSSGIAERIGTEQGLLKLVDLKQVKHEEKLAGADHRSALLRVIEILSKKGRFGNRCKTEPNHRHGFRPALLSHTHERRAHDCSRNRPPSPQKSCESRSHELIAG